LGHRCRDRRGGNAKVGDDRDPLLVRPFVLPDGARQEQSSSASTWPAEQQAGELPTQLLPAVPDALSEESEQAGPGTQWRRRTVQLIGAGAVVMSTVTGYSLLQPSVPPETWVSVPGQSLPAVVGPAASAGVVPDVSPPPGDGTGEGSGRDSTGQVTETTRPARTASASADVGASSVSPSAGGASSATSVAPVAPIGPIALTTSAAAAGSGLLVNGSGLCLDLVGGEASEGRDVHVDDCNGTSPQRWELTADRALEVLDRCAYLVGDGTVELAGCDGRTAAQWRLLGDGTLTNVANGQCLTDPYSGARPGNAVIVTACTGGSNQRWAFRK
jgi:hypothetical protein